MPQNSNRVAADPARGNPGCLTAAHTGLLPTPMLIPVRSNSDTQEVVGHLVVWCQVHDCDLADVTDADLAKVSEHLTPDVRQVLTVEGALAARQGHGGTAPVRVAEQIAALRVTVHAHAAWAAGDSG